jgi:hypothetical protein
MNTKYVYIVKYESLDYDGGLWGLTCWILCHFYLFGLDKFWELHNVHILGDITHNVCFRMSVTIKAILIFKLGTHDNAFLLDATGVV